MVNQYIGPGWRLVHDGSQVLSLFESDGDTSTEQDLFHADTRDECLAEIARLGLTFDVEEKG